MLSLCETKFYIICILLMWCDYLLIRNTCQLSSHYKYFRYSFEAIVGCSSFNKLSNLYALTRRFNLNNFHLYTTTIWQHVTTIKEVILHKKHCRKDHPNSWYDTLPLSRVCLSGRFCGVTNWTARFTLVVNIHDHQQFWAAKRTPLYTAQVHLNKIETENIVQACFKVLLQDIDSIKRICKASFLQN